ncbi:sensor histidine kinase [Actinomadura sp. NEAU-AAG7]|uniref:sensor histidine kinase n=1 Tax=Actinomadura sp. NEAU-AAG7 TaxID=2839640 RepID=UPI001BE49CBB|nr:sensor histidine kinase [Actinomadura sp. NEAU-AAG7]MBT2206680.1 sensor domain-containing protein [Actinomadura sp. NEAU-AAG7]
MPAEHCGRTRARGEVRQRLLCRARRALDALEQLVGGLGTAILAVIVLIALAAAALASALGIGTFLRSAALRGLRFVADRERARLSHCGPEMIDPRPAPAGVRAAAADPSVRRELSWLITHSTFGMAVGLAGAPVPYYVVRDLTYPLYWWAVPGDASERSPEFWDVHGFADALCAPLAGLGWAVAFMGLAPAMARLQAWPGRRLLSPVPVTDLSLRVARLSATRAAALDAHATELRRIERSLHDGTQNRLVAVTVMLGATRRALARDPSGAAALLDRAQDASEQALAELREVVRGILPPVLDDRGLAGALAGLVAACAVPCRLNVDVPGRCAASVEATAYFVVAEALTNISRHSGARRAAVTVRRHRDRLLLWIGDDGDGGADETRGSGLAGIRHRVQALDGRLIVTSPPGGPTTLEAELPCGS